jgi:hypothetical protein
MKQTLTKMTLRQFLAQNLLKPLFKAIEALIGKSDKY